MPLGARILPPPPAPDPELVKRLAQVRTTDLSDVMGGSYTMTGQIAPVHRPVVRVAGPALTVSVPTNSEFLIKYALNTARAGDVVVVNALGNMTSVLAGSNMMRGLLNRGAVAAVFDGIVRDVDEIAEDGLPVFARGVACAEGPCGPDQGEINVPIACGGTVVAPGDIVVVDEEGIAVVPVAFAEEVLERAHALEAKHDAAQESLRQGTQANIAKIEETLRQAGIDFPS
ncbi:RraA family protein [Nocardioides humi]|uniref:Putative 4-hydroxy-4-methyl-2-oxoglutarate aldolase n=1 Tax=Nocardioides humi TaxID=449461 RepID=A0ABN2BQF4_9ACTN|nr:RraA family protein [Nocardioides humi]